MKKYYLVGLLILVLATMQANKIEIPRIHAGIMLDSKFYSGDNSNSGDYDSSNRFQVRKAAFEITGNLSHYVDYAIEAGVSTCSGGGTGVKLMDAVINYKWNRNITLSIKQGHILRGFSGSTECSDRVPMERPVFYTSMATCHPTGFVANFIYDLPHNADIEFEAAFMDGKTGTLDGEHDYNFGTIINTPISGLAITGVYNHVSNNFYIDGSIVSKDGDRVITGLKYDISDFNLTGEYFTGKGFDTYEREYEAYYLLGSYRYHADNISRISYLEPNVRFSFWDKMSEKSEASKYKYLDIGLVISLDSTTKIKLNYQTNLDKPETSPEIPSSFIARLQINI